MSAFFQVALAMIAMSTAIEEGKAEKETRDLNSFNIKTDAVMSRAQAMQQTNLRFKEFKEAMAVSDTFFGAVSGRIEDASVRAFKSAELETTGEDISDVELMSRLNQLKLESEAITERRLGKDALRAGYTRAAMIGLQTAIDISDTSKGKGSSKTIADAKQSGSSNTLLQSPRPRYRPT